MQAVSYQSKYIHACDITECVQPGSTTSVATPNYYSRIVTVGGDSKGKETIQFLENNNCRLQLIDVVSITTKCDIYVIVIPRYEYDIVVITRVRGEAEYEC